MAPARRARRRHVDDLWAVELREVAASVAARVDDRTARALVVAALHGGGPTSTRAAEVLGAELGCPGRALPRAEAAAARVGRADHARRRPGGAVVVDLGGGTDRRAWAGSGREVVAAGAGEMLTAAVADLPRPAPRGGRLGQARPCSRLEAPQVLLAEDGVAHASSTVRRQPAAVGSLVVSRARPGCCRSAGRWPRPSGEPLRLRTKQRVLAGQRRERGARPRRTRPAGPPRGRGRRRRGAAGAGPAGATWVPVGVGDVAGGLGHRYAVAYGLALLALGSAGV